MNKPVVGRVPRVSSEAAERTIMVRLTGAVHARLCEERERRGRSINKLVIDAIHRSLPLPIVAAERDEPDANAATETQP